MAGAQVTVTVRPFTRARGRAMVSGVPAGVTGADVAEEGEVPAALRAWTLNRYAVPLTSPSTVALVLEPPTATWRAPGLAVTTHWVTGCVPGSAAVHRTSAAPSPRTAVIPTGAVGATSVEDQVSAKGPAAPALEKLSTARR